MVKDARELDDLLKFDKILLDAPCSGSGTICFEEESSYKNFTEELINKSAKRQANLIQKALKLLKPGGELVYSTCSILKNENENVINRILNDKIQIIPIVLDESIPLLPTTINGTICVRPTKQFEGFFIAKLRKK